MTSRSRAPISTSWLLIAAGFLLLRLWESRGLVGGYDANVYWIGAHQLVHGHDPYAAFAFVTPPSGLPFLAVLGVLPYSVAYAALQALATLSMVGAIFLVVRAQGVHWRGALLAGLLLTAGTAGTFQTLGFGNLNGVILLTWVLALLASSRDDDRALGLWFGLGLALKPVLVPVGLLLLVSRRWRAAGWSALIPAVTWIIGLFFVGTSFLTDTLPNLENGLSRYFPVFNDSLQGFGNRHHAPHAVIWTARLLAVSATVAIAVLVWRAARETTRWNLPTVRLLEVGSVLLLGTFLASPIAWRYYSIFLLPWLVHLVATRGRELPWLHLLGWSLLLLPDNMGLAFDARGALHFNQDRPTLALGVLLLAAWFDARAGHRAPLQTRTA